MLTLNLIKKKFNKTLFLGDVKTAAKTMRDEALGVFLDTLVKEIPVWSGAAKATLIPLGRLIKRLVDIQPKVSPPFADPDEHGIAAGKKAGKARNISSNYEFGFTFSHTLTHYYLNEHFFQNFGPGTKPTPWETLKDASLSWTEFMRKNSVLFLPWVRDYIEDK